MYPYRFWFATTYSTHTSSDTPAELALVREAALAGGADAAVVSNHWALGGAGARALAESVIATCEGPSGFKFLYDLDLTIEQKISIICKEIYGAHGIELSDLALQQIATYTRQGYGNLPSKDLLLADVFIHMSMSSLHGQDAIFIFTRC